MQFQNLSTTDVSVSKACLGTMSFGAHVDEAAAWTVMDKALELEVNFFDTAELYAVPPEADTHGETERIIGRWMKERGNRDQLVIATKVAGPAQVNAGGLKWMRDGELDFSEESICIAVDGSLERLQTDYIDLYQLHWPDRHVNAFGRRTFTWDGGEHIRSCEEILTTLQKLVDEGKIRHIGLSNETPWGTMKFLQAAKEMGLPRPVSVQNNYSLLTRSYDNGMAEVSHREDIGLLAYSPLGYGVLGGRYLDGAKPEGGRFTKYPWFAARYQTERVESLVRQYKHLAESHGMSLATMAQAFVYSRSFVTSCIIGPSNVEQLEENIAAMDVVLSEEILAGIEEIHESCPNPAA